MGALRHTELLDSLERLAATVAVEEGVEFVDLSLRGPSGHRLLRVDIDRPGARGASIDDCQRVSQALGRALDEAELIASRYVLEVSSSGVDRPIVTDDDYRRNVGRRVIVVAASKDGEPRQWCGELLGLEGGHVHLRTGPGVETTVPRSDVVEARQDVVF